MRYLECLTYEDWCAENPEFKYSKNYFERCVVRAQRIIDRETHSRIKSMAEVPEEVKEAMHALVILDINNRAAVEGTGVLKSFSTDGYSETYEPITQERLNAMRYEIINEYLSEVTDDNGTPLLYMGVEA